MKFCVYQYNMLCALKKMLTVKVRKHWSLVFQSLKKLISATGMSIVG